MNQFNKSVTIAVLCVTAVMLLCTLFIVSNLPIRTAAANGPMDRQGDYIMVPADTSRGAGDAVIVVDLAARRLAAYVCDPARKRIEHVGIYDLQRLP